MNQNSNNDGVAQANQELVCSSTEAEAAGTVGAGVVGLQLVLPLLGPSGIEEAALMGRPAVSQATNATQGSEAPVTDKARSPPLPPTKGAAPKGPGGKPPSLSQSKEKKEWGIRFTGVLRINENATDAIAYLTHIGAPFELVGPGPINLHQVAAACRANARLLVVRMCTEAMRRIAADRQKAGLPWDQTVVIMYHSRSELTFMSNAFKDSLPPVSDRHYRKGKLIQPLSGLMTMVGWRDKSFGTDDVRERPVVINGHHLTAPILYFGDSIHHFSPEQFIALVGNNVNTKLETGLLVLVVARHLPKEDGSVLFETFKAPEAEIAAGVENKTDSEGVQYTVPRSITVGPTDRLEARAYVKDGEIMFYASGPGDSVYRHRVEDWVYRHSVVFVEREGRFYSIGIHVDRSSGPYGVIRLLVKQVPELGANLVVQPLVPSSWVTCGYRLVKMKSLAFLQVIRMDANSEVSIQAAVASLTRRVFATLGVNQTSHMQDFFDILSQSVKNDLEVSYADSRRMLDLDLHAAGGPRETGIRFTSERIQQETGLGTGVSTNIARMVRQQTRFEFLLACVHAVRDLGSVCATWLWEQISAVAVWFRRTVMRSGKVGGGDASLSALVHMYRLGVGFLRRFRATAALLDRAHGKLSGLRLTDSFHKWAHAHPIVAAVLEEALTFAACFLTAIIEEIGKKIVGPGWTVLFAAGEAVIASLADVIESKDIGLVMLAKQVIKREITHIVKHLLLWAMPLWISIPVHTLTNYLEHSRFWKKSFQGFTREFEDARRSLPGQEIEMQPLGFSLPPNLVDEVENVFHREPDGTLTPLAEVYDAFQGLDNPLPSNTYHRVLLADDNCALVKPSNDLLNMIVVVVKRLEQLPNFTPVKGIWKTTLAKYLQNLVDLDSASVDVLTLEEAVEYYQQRPWTEGHKKLRISQLFLCLGLPEDYKGPLGQLKCFVKIDETLKINPSLSEENDACKSRPVMPLNTLGVPDILWLKPMKEYMAIPDNWMLVDGKAVLLGPEEEGGDFYFVYVLLVRPDLLGELVTDLLYERGYKLVWLAHGDDSLILGRVQDRIAAFAVDLATCDLTCGPEVQTSFVSYTNFATAGTVQSELERWLKRKTGTIHLQCPEAAELGLDLVMEQERLQTLTGEQATSVLAVFPQKVMCPIILERCCVDGEFIIEKLPKVLVTVMQAHGLDPVSDYAIEWTPLEATPFLGGVFAHQENRLVFFSLSFSKLLLGPCKSSLSNDDKEVAWLKDLSVAVEERALQATPPGRALISLFERVLDFRDFSLEKRRNAVQEHLNAMKVSNPWKYERTLEIGEYEVPKVSFETYLRSMSCFARMLGNPDPTDEIERFVEACNNVQPASCNGSIKIDATANFAFLARFGVKPEARHEGHGA